MSRGGRIWERVALGLVRTAAWLVPAEKRTAWREEWASEVWHFLRSPERGRLAGAHIALRCLGAFPHAISIRRGEEGMGTIVENARSAGKRLTRNPAFTVPAILVFGIAVAAAATIFSSYEAVVLRSLTFAEPERLVSVWDEHTERGWFQEYVAPANLFDWREQVSSFADVAAYGDYSWEQILLLDGEATVVEAGPVSGNLFDVLGVQPELGRGFRMEETWSDAEPVTVLSHGFWVDRFGADPEALGSTLELSGTAYRIVGVMPEGFRYLSPDKALWIPFRWDPEAPSEAFFRRAHLVRAVARLAPDATAAEARAELGAVAARLADAYPGTNEGLGAGITPLGAYLAGDRVSTLRALLGGVSLLLLAACVNVGYLILLRWARRQREVAIRRALGAGPASLVREAGFEGLCISTAGAALGVVGSLYGMRLLASLTPPELLAAADLRLSAPLLAGAVTVMAVAALLFTLLPARMSAGVREDWFGGHESRSVLGGRGSRTVRAFVVLQISLSAVLVFSSVLFARSFLSLRSVDAGFEASGVLTFAVPYPDGSDEAAPERIATSVRISDALADLTGVVAVGATRRLPITGNGWTSFFAIEGEGAGSASFEIVHREADAGYFEAMQVPVVRGRPFQRDESGTIMVNETFARRAFGDEDPIGSRVAFTEEPSPTSTWWRIVGVVGDERQNGLRAEARPEVFTDYSFDTPATFRFVVRASGDPMALVPSARQVLRDVDPRLPMDEIASLDEIVRGSLAQDRFLTVLAAAFAALAALLAVVGVYGVTAQLAEGWRREFALRLAMGAAPRALFGSVMGRAATLVGAGLVLGALGSYLAAGVVQSLLYQSGPGDLLSALVAGAVVGATGLAAALPPALRAARTDPASALAA